MRTNNILKSGGTPATPTITYTSRIRAIGNSKGVILNSQAIELAGLNSDKDIIVEAVSGTITIFQVKNMNVNTDLSTWGNQFRKAIKNGSKPEGDMFKGIENEFDTTEW